MMGLLSLHIFMALKGVGAGFLLVWIGLGYSKQIMKILTDEGLMDTYVVHDASKCRLLP